MVLKFIHNNRLLQVQQASEIELDQLQLTSTVNWVEYLRGKREKKSKSFLLNSTYLPGGFWHKILSLASKKYAVRIMNTNDFVRNVTIEEINDWIDSVPLLPKIIPRWYQRKGVYLAIKYRISRGEFATSAGKSLILYLVARYCLEKLLPDDKKILLVVPSVQLVSQMANDFASYQTDDYIQTDKIYGGSKRNKTARVVIGNIDSLINYDSDFFEQFDVILYDEAHKLKTSGYQKIIDYMHATDFKLIYAVSGTFYKTDTIEDYTAEAISGPVLMRVGAKLLMDEGSVTPLKISIIKMIHPHETSERYYNHPDCQKIHLRNDFEMKFIQSLPDRFLKMTMIISKLPHNQLVLFKSVKYCKIFYEYLSKKYPEKHVRIIHGDISSGAREEIKQFTEDNDNVIICATYGCMSTGISILNLGCLHSAEGSKSFIIIRQSIGRTLRLHPSKTYAQYLDWVDIFIRHDTKWLGPKRMNIAHKHSSARKKIYDEQEFEYIETTINL